MSTRDVAESGGVDLMPLPGRHDAKAMASEVNREEREHETYNRSPGARKMVYMLELLSHALSPFGANIVRCSANSFSLSRSPGCCDGFNTHQIFNPWCGYIQVHRPFASLWASVTKPGCVTRFQLDNFQLSTLKAVNCSLAVSARAVTLSEMRLIIKEVSSCAVQREIDTNT